MLSDCLNIGQLLIKKALAACDDGDNTLYNQHVSYNLQLAFFLLLRDLPNDGHQETNGG